MTCYTQLSLPLCILSVLGPLAYVNHHSYKKCIKSTTIAVGYTAPIEVVLRSQPKFTVSFLLCYLPYQISLALFDHCRSVPAIIGSLWEPPTSADSFTSRNYIVSTGEEGEEMISGEEGKGISESFSVLAAIVLRYETLIRDTKFNNNIGDLNVGHKDFMVQQRAIEI
ncbi:unnamed protein product [Lactuca virosa]|uniref:Uncharacterized protein n=1 Tax=Lactuca virosa TaxID=75947 RepID=A0AAU9NZD6_9ASTR|nr:unnamed protein product [Lactuca virosa]